MDENWEKSIVIIGVSNRLHIINILGSETKYTDLVEKYAKEIAKKYENVIITPDDGIYTDIAEKWQEITNKKATAYYPDKDTYYGIEHIKHNFSKYATKGIGGDWYKLNAELTKQAKTVLCLGITPGVLIELAYIKYHQKYGGHKNPKYKEITLIIDERLIEQRLPKTVEKEINNIKYINNVEKI